MQGNYAIGILLIATAAWAAEDADWPRVPRFRVSDVIAGSPRASENPRYPAFPALWRLEGDRVLITYKDGTGHTHDPGAELAVVERTLTSGEQREVARFVPPVPLLYQCAEPVRFADGTLALFIDTQRIGPEPRHYRAPMRWTRSRDGGRSFGAAQEFPVVDGVGYGYPFEAQTSGGETLLMVMTFGYLPGGRWSVDMLRTRDSGVTWQRIRNLSEELNVPGFNEGTFLAHGDGYLVASRSYDRQARLHEVDREFRRRRDINLTEASAWINGYIGRPRLFRHDGAIFLIGRNWTQPLSTPGSARSADNPLGFPRAQQLCLFRIDPHMLRPVSCWILDNAEQGAVSDGYYAVVATTGAADDPRLHVITYKGVNGGPTYLPHLQFKWSELNGN